MNGVLQQWEIALPVLNLCPSIPGSVMHDPCLPRQRPLRLGVPSRTCSRIKDSKVMTILNPFILLRLHLKAPMHLTKPQANRTWPGMEAP